MFVVIGSCENFCQCFKNTLIRKKNFQPRANFCEANKVVIYNINYCITSLFKSNIHNSIREFHLSLKTYWRKYTLVSANSANLAIDILQCTVDV